MTELYPTQYEIEVKLSLGSFTNYLKLIGFLGHIDSEEHQLNGFFDTPDCSLLAGGWALRVRAENDQGRITAKSTKERGDLAVVRQEIEELISRGDALALLSEQANVLECNTAPVRYIVEQFHPRQLCSSVFFSNTRQRKLLRLGDFNYLLEVDKTEFADGSIDYELEIELPDTDRVEQLEGQLHKLFDSLDIPFIHQPDSKLARALKLTRK
ncbi:MAG: CYTH domain-containing protein [Candidatus Zixiibacteriota bacterium]